MNARSLSHLLPAALLLPFLGKAFHVDDAQFLCFSRVIASDPLRAIQLVVPCEPFPVRLCEMPHPLFFQYLVAGVVRVFGESEAALHALVLLFALLGLHGVALLADRLGVPRLAATFLVASSSAFLTMGSTVMPDAPMAGCAAAAMGFLARGVEEGKRRDLVLAGLLAGAAFLTRYSALPLFALLLAYPLLRRSRRLRAYVPFLVGTGVAVAWELATWRLCGHPHFLSTATSPTWSSSPTFLRVVSTAFAQLVHLGAQLPLLGLPVLALLVAPRLRRGIALALASLALTVLLASRQAEPHRVALVLVAWPAVAALVLAFLRLLPALRRAVGGALGERDALRALLALWLLSTLFITVTYVHVAAKYALLPLPAGVLLVLDALLSSGAPKRLAAGTLAVSAAATVVVGLLVAVSDYRWASGYRALFESGAGRLAPPPGGVTYVNARWGLGYYGERAGLVPFFGQPISPRDRIVTSSLVPAYWGGTNERTKVVDEIELQQPGPFALLWREGDAGFYSGGWGRLPFVPARGGVRETLTVHAAVTALP